MIEPEVLMPVNCPQCGTESLCRLSVSAAADALIAGNPLPLRSGCHAQVWMASLAEREQLREYLGAACIDSGTPALEHLLPRYSVLLHEGTSALG
jgi:hypothetical protein